jgi:Asp-tRNA(Asn)/Glu-tRNA(Gln) amidotransferase A subunit family amidase
MQAMAALFKEVDVIVAPTFGSTQLVATNLTGHPACILPDGFRTDGTPVSITFVGDLFREDQLLAVARAYQNATHWHLNHPDLKPPTNQNAKPTK